MPFYNITDVLAHSHANVNFEFVCEEIRTANEKNQRIQNRRQLTQTKNVSWIGFAQSLKQTLQMKYTVENIHWQSQQPTDWLSDQLTYLSINWLTHQPTSQSTHWLTDQPTDRLTSWRTIRLTDKPTDWLSDWLTNRLTDHPLTD